MNLETYTLPAFWASALVNGDRSGLEPADIAALDAWLAQTFPHGANCVSCGDKESDFRWRHDASPHVLACNVSEYTFDVGMPANEKETAVTANFWDWFNGVTATALATEEGKAFAAAGFALAHTGGGCTAWERPVGSTGWRVLITDSEGLGHKLEGESVYDPGEPDHWLVGAQNNDGDGPDCVKAATVAEALAAADRLHTGLIEVES
jgi:hypothetical protein